MTIVDLVFADPRFAELYDLFNPWMACDDFYRATAVASGGPVLDVGCGTGMLACAIAAQGVEVVGADPAAAMLAVARVRSGADRVTWVHSAGQDLALGRRFAFAYMTGHAFQAILTDAEAVALLRAVADHLLPGGHFIIETRNPALRAWERWVPSAATVRISPLHGRVEEVDAAAHDPATGIVTVDTRYRLLDSGEERAGGSRLRFIGQDHLARLVGEAGLRVAGWLGDWDGAPFQAAGSPEIICIMER